MIRLRKNPVRLGTGFRLFVWPAFRESWRSLGRAFSALLFVLVTDRIQWKRK